MQLDVTIAGTLRAAMALLFAAGLTHKLWNLAGFRQTVRQYLQGMGITNRRLDRLAAMTVLALEFAVVVACVVPGFSGIAAALASGTLLAYGTAMGVNLLRGNELLDCGCHWGNHRQPVRPALVVRNALLALVATAIALPVADRNVLTLDVVSIVLATLAVSLLYAAANQMLGFDTHARRNH